MQPRYINFHPTLTTRLVVVLLLASLVPLGLLALGSYAISSEVLVEQGQRNNARFIDGLVSYENLYVRQIEALVNSIVTNERLGQVLSDADHQTEDNSFARLNAQAQVGYVLGGYNSLPGIVSIDLFTPSGRQFHMGDTLEVSAINSGSMHELFTLARKQRGATVWAGAIDNINTHSKVRHVQALVRMVTHFSADSGQSEDVGLLVVNLDDSVLRAYSESAQQRSAVQIVQVDRAGRIVFDQNEAHIGQPASQALLDIVAHGTSRQRAKLDGRDVLVDVVTAAHDSGWLVVILPLDYIHATTAQLAKVSAAALAICALIVFGVTTYFIHAVVTPIRKVSRGFKRLADNRAATTEFLEGDPTAQDEIGLLISGYNRQLDLINALRESQISAEAANEAKSQFLANMSHEIRTPMNGVLGMLLMAQDEKDPQRKDELLAKAHESGGVLLGIINDILDLSKIEAGKLTLEQTAFSLHRCMRDIGETFTPLAKRSQTQFHMDIAKDVPEWLTGDPLRIRQVLYNLVSNAIKFTEAGEVAISATASVRDGNADLTIAVRDTGIGIDSATLSTLFQPFTQADASTSRHFGGTGLGLVITRNLVELMGGRINVVSTPGHGSTFTFQLRLPLAQPPSTTDASAKLDLDAYRAALADARVLLVEDNHLNQQIATHFLSKVGITPEIAENGAVALAKLDAEAFDLVLMDCQMPVMDGYEATRRIRANPKLKGQPVVAMTANAMAADRARSLEAGMNDHINKPIDAAELYSKLMKWLGERSANAPVPTQAKPVLTVADNEAIPGPLHIDVSQLALLNTDGAIRHMGGMEDLYYAMVQLFPDSATEQVDHFSKAIEQDDLKSAQRAVHSLKSIARTIGAERLGEFADQAEQLAGQRGLSAIATLLPELHALLAESQTALSALTAPRQR
jgi:signal transduction histidine kinase/HPt (histidine-containing phosphotransfer) domain-containing protein/ActR/RegA family two-component response regulator